LQRVDAHIFSEEDMLDDILRDKPYLQLINIAKIETHLCNNKEKKMLVHRKGATRAFSEQLVLIPGGMGTRSYIMVGTRVAGKVSFASSCHGAGRKMLRKKARKSLNADIIM
jgi:tRNA-splicing ligase RtcB